MPEGFLIALLTFASFAVGMTVVSVVADGHARSLCDGAHMLLWPDVGRLQIERASSGAEWPISRTLNSANLAKLLRETGCRRFFGEGREDAFNTRR